VLLVAVAVVELKEVQRHQEDQMELVEQAVEAEENIIHLLVQVVRLVEQAKLEQLILEAVAVVEHLQGLLVVQE
jgi:hypothetical protein